MKFAEKIPNYYETTGNSKGDDCTWPFLSSFPGRAIPSVCVFVWCVCVCVCVVCVCLCGVCVFVFVCVCVVCVVCTHISTYVT